jgi:hypothetical protein
MQQSQGPFEHTQIESFANLGSNAENSQIKKRAHQSHYHVFKVNKYFPMPQDIAYFRLIDKLFSWISKYRDEYTNKNRQISSKIVHVYGTNQEYQSIFETNRTAEKCATSVCVRIE